nr:hypothetical protein [Candidatus Sigynarchaeota archaeon]
MNKAIDILEGLLNMRLISTETAQRRDEVLNDASEKFAVHAKALLAKGDLVGVDVLLEYSLNACPCQRRKDGPCPRCTESRDLAAKVKAQLPRPQPQQETRPHRQRKAPECPEGV